MHIYLEDVNKARARNGQPPLDLASEAAGYLDSDGAATDEEDRFLATARRCWREARTGNVHPAQWRAALVDKLEGELYFGMPAARASLVDAIDLLSEKDRQAYGDRLALELVDDRFGRPAL